MIDKGKKITIRSGFTVLELMVPVAVTALLATALLTISSQVLETQRLASEDLETNQVAQFVLDQIQEDLQCALYQNDGNVWMAIRILDTKENSQSWVDVNTDAGKPLDDSLRLIRADWPEGEILPENEYDILAQAPFERSRFGVAGTWLRFFTQSPEFDQNVKSIGAARAVSYQIIRHSLTESKTSSMRYQLFRSDVSAVNIWHAGYNLHPDKLKYPGIQYYSYSSGSLDPRNPNSPRVPSAIQNPIVVSPDYSPASFSLAANIIDFGVRAYVMERNSFGTGKLIQVFPTFNNGKPNEFLATSSVKDHTFGYPYHSFPDVVDLFVRVLTNKGAKLLENYENGLFQTTDEQNWWTIAEENSEVYVRRVKIYGSGL